MCDTQKNVFYFRKIGFVKDQYRQAIARRCSSILALGTSVRAVPSPGIARSPTVPGPVSLGRPFAGTALIALGTDKLTYTLLRILVEPPLIAPPHISKTQRHAFVETGSDWLKPGAGQG